MKEPVRTSLHKYFESFPDYRISRNKKHLLVDIIIPHGRLETRKCDVIRRLDFIDSHVQWKGICSVVRITATRENDNKKTSETRYYISSLNERAADMNRFIRQHWGSGTNCTGHWTWYSERTASANEQKTPQTISLTSGK